MKIGNKAVFLDTFFIQALLNRRDNFHAKAKELFPQVQAIPEVWTTEAGLIEVGNALSSINREGAAEFIRNCYTTPNLKVIKDKKDIISRRDAKPPRVEGRKSIDFKAVEMSLLFSPAWQSTPPIVVMGDSGFPESTAVNP